jgi:sporulation protein YqfD
MKNALLEALPELRWAGINTYGCTAVISVSERALFADRQEQATVSSILASRDGIITSATAAQGNLLCSEGQAVKAGDVLISGYQDCEIALRAVHAEGEVYALTNRQLRAIVPLDWSVRTNSGAVSQKYSLIFGKKRINLWKGSGISDTTCVRMYEEYYITLPGGFYLPVRVGVERVIDGCTVDEVYPENETGAVLTDFAERYLNQQMVAGMITQSHIQTTCDGAIGRLTGNYFCVEMIGTLRHNEIGEYNGKDS